MVDSLCNLDALEAWSEDNPSSASRQKKAPPPPPRKKPRGMTGVNHTNTKNNNNAYGGGTKKSPAKSVVAANRVSRKVRRAVSPDPTATARERQPQPDNDQAKKMAPAVTPSAAAAASRQLTKPPQTPRGDAVKVPKSNKPKLVSPEQRDATKRSSGTMARRQQQKKLFARKKQHPRSAYKAPWRTQTTRPPKEEEEARGGAPSLPRTGVISKSGAIEVARSAAGGQDRQLRCERKRYQAAREPAARKRRRLEAQAVVRAAVEEAKARRLREEEEKQAQLRAAAAKAPSAAPEAASVDETTIAALEEKYRDIMCDADGKQRMTFVAVPEVVTNLLVDVWGLKENPDAPPAQMGVDANGNATVVAPAQQKQQDQPQRKATYVDDQLFPVQSYAKHVLNHLLESPGFPCAPGVAGREFFCKQNKTTVQQAQAQLEEAIAGKLRDLDYCRDDQEVDFYLSFMKSDPRFFMGDTARQAQAQIPQTQTQKKSVSSSKAPDQKKGASMSEVPDLLPEEEEQPSFMLQEAHIDFEWHVVDPKGSGSTRRSDRARRKQLPYAQRVPFIGFFPLTEDGMTLQIWKARATHGQAPEKDGDEEKDDKGTLLSFPRGIMLICRGDTMHAGGFCTAPNGNPRAHLYIYRHDGEVHDSVQTKNSYEYQPAGETKTQRFSQVYLHHPDAVEVAPGKAVP